MERVFLAEDNSTLAETLQRYLSKSGYEIFHRDKGDESLDFIVKNNSQLDLVLLDIKLPILDGLEVCRKARKKDIQIPILMLTSNGDVDVIVEALHIGADDYLTKPFALPELLARIKALLRRPSYFESRVLKEGPLEVDLDARQARYMGVELKLRRKEFDLLHYLLRNRNQMLSREQILLNVWDYDTKTFQNTVDVHIRQLRKNFESVRPEGIALIQTVYGFGYKLNVPNESKEG